MFTVKFNNFNYVMSNYVCLKYYKIFKMCEYPQYTIRAIFKFSRQLLNEFNYLIS